MKTLLTLLSLVLTLNTYSQKGNGGVILDKGQKFLVRTTSSQEADMGMGMEMKNNSTSQNNFIVLDTDKDIYTVSSTLTGLKLSIDFMGQQTNYDSDLKSDTASEIGKSITNLNIPDTVTVNKFTATAVSNKKIDPAVKEGDSNPMEALFEMLGNSTSDISLTDAFFIIPAGKNAGDSWTDSSSVKDQKTTRTYTIASIDKGIATINVLGNVTNNVQTEAQGLQVSVSMVTKTNSEIIVDIKTSLVSKRTTKADITGTLELMGQSAPITGKSTTTSIYEY